MRDEPHDHVALSLREESFGFEIIDEINFESPPVHWSEKYKKDRYDWNDPEFLRNNRGRFAYRIVDLTKGYFAVVTPQMYRLVSQFSDGVEKKWHAKIQYDREGNIVKVYACRRGRANEPKDVYMHREITGCIDRPGVADHLNGEGLDNRGTPKNPVNLRYVGRSENNHNSRRARTKHHGLPAGVEFRGGRYRGIRCKRLGKHRVLVIRSKRTWKTPEPAHQWYLNQLKKLHQGRKSWIHNPTSVNHALFPPLLETELSPRSLKLRRKADFQREADIPF